MDLSLEKWLIREKNGEGVKKKICWGFAFGETYNLRFAQIASKIFFSLPHHFSREWAIFLTRSPFSKLVIHFSSLVQDFSSTHIKNIFNSLDNKSYFTSSKNNEVCW
jgi:hypothetical protein